MSSVIFMKNLRDIETAVHNYVDRTKKNAVDRHTLTRQKHPQRLSHIEYCCL